MSMHKTLMFVSLASVLLLSGGLVIEIFFIAAEFSWWALPGVVIGGFFLMIVASVLFGVYYFRQERAINQRLKQRGMAPLIQRELLHGKITEARRPYLREGRLLLMVWVSMAFAMLSMPTV